MAKNRSNTKKGLARERAKRQAETTQRKNWERNLTNLNDKEPEFVNERTMPSLNDFMEDSED